MFIGECPYCDKIVANNVEGVGIRTVYCKATCEHCNMEFWLAFSYLGAEAYTTETFEQLFTVDFEKQTIAPRNINS